MAFGIQWGVCNSFWVDTTRFLVANMNEREIVRDQLVCHQHEPVVLSGLISGWAASSWTPEGLTEVLGDQPLKFRVGKLTSTEVQWENKCDYVSASVGEFNEWVKGECPAENPLHNYDCARYWCYADYKYMAELFEDQPHFLKAVDWSVLGFKDREGQQSTFWLGSQGSNTVCHYDTYGCNLVAQLYGRKQWILFAPSDTKYMYPTRIPYEESSVFSRVPVKSPDLNQFPEFQHVTPYVVTLEPGDVLFVPPKWWHFVQSLEPSISVNSWIEMVGDDSERLREAMTRTMAFMLMSETDTPINSWLNPTEDVSDQVQNTEYVRLTLTTVLNKGLADDFMKRAKPAAPHGKRPRENSRRDDTDGQTWKLPRTHDKTHNDVILLESQKAFDIIALCKNLGGQARKVNASSWTEYCQMFKDVKDWSSACIELIDVCAEQYRTEDDSGKSSGASKAEGVLSLEDPNHTTTNSQISTRCHLASGSSHNFLKEITLFDLADVLLDPEVVDLMCQKLIRKFQTTTLC